MEIRYPSFGTIVIEGTRYDHDVVIDHGVVRRRDKGPSKVQKLRTGHTPLTAAEEIPWTGTVLLIGTGHSGRLPVMDDVRSAAVEHGVELTELPTAQACELLTTMNLAGTTAILHVTC
jgi:hypothetical protein